MTKHNFKSLKIWQRAMDLTDMTYDYCKDLPVGERYNLIDQLNRCSCSILSNIAEGSGKRNKIHFAEFLTTSLTSSFEVETQLLICERRSYGSGEKLKKCMEVVIEIQKRLYSFREFILNSEE